MTKIIQRKTQQKAVRSTQIIMGKYSKFADPDYHVKTFRWPYWLLPLLFLSLLLVLGLFIFITIHSADRFGCLFSCEQKIDNGGLRAPSEDQAALASRRNDQNITGVSEPTKSSTGEESQNSTQTHLQSKETSQKMTVKGKLLFPGKYVPNTMPPNSHLTVTFEDSSIQDASSEILGTTVVDVTSYKKGTDLTYKIECVKPKNYHGMYSVSAVLNMGWTPGKGKNDPWLRKGDYFTDTMYTVALKKNVTVFERDITFAYSSQG